ncbi:MAG: hypothetical protein NW224_02965 [Leptolyngbyaceae cyanobacterium bins.302]|nr:hypothetical protein [Leptolyngbyaceae cyanobacterium bins.302]
MLFIALGVHSFLLFFPWRSLQPNQAQKASGESVKLSRLTTLKPGETPADQSKSAEATTRNLNRSEIVVKASPSPTPSPTPLPKAAKPSPAPIVTQTPQKTATKTKAPTPTQTAVQTAKLTAKEQAFVSRLQKLEGREVNEPVSSTLFPNPEDFYQDPVKELGQPGIVGIEYVSFQRPEQVYQQLVKLYPDYAIVPKSEFGGGLVYEFKQGNFVRHLNLIRAKLGAGTLIILWNREPSQKPRG